MSYYNFDTIVLPPEMIVEKMKKVRTEGVTLEKTLINALGTFHWRGDIYPEGRVFATTQFTYHLPKVLPCSMFEESTEENIEALNAEWKREEIDRVLLTYTMKIDNQQTQYIILDDIHSI